MPSAQKEMLRFGVPLAALGIILCALAPHLFALGHPWLKTATILTIAIVGLLVIFVCYFFRDPQRVVPEDAALIVSAADGRVVGIEEMEEPDFHLGPMLRISIFLSVFDVHINRTPCDGTVRSTIYKSGKFLDVRHPNSSTLNECRSWLLDTAHGPVAVRQIAGLIARRIVAWSAEGATLERGERFGMIRFGSRTEVFLPVGCTVLVKLGDRVEGAATPIARWPGIG